MLASSVGARVALRRGAAGRAAGSFQRFSLVAPAASMIFCAAAGGLPGANTVLSIIGQFVPLRPAQIRQGIRGKKRSRQLAADSLVQKDLRVHEVVADSDVVDGGGPQVQPLGLADIRHDIVVPD